jgi:hypothetical protein
MLVYFTNITEGLVLRPFFLISWITNIICEKLMSEGGIKKKKEKWSMIIFFPNGMRFHQSARVGGKINKTRGVRSSRGKLSRGKLGGFPARAVPISPISHFTLKMNSPLESP